MGKKFGVYRPLKDSMNQYRRFVFEIEEEKCTKYFMTLMEELVKAYIDINRSEINIAKVWGRFFSTIIEQKNAAGEFKHEIYTMEIEEAVNQLKLKRQPDKIYNLYEVPTVIRMFYEPKLIPKSLKIFLGENQTLMSMKKEDNFLDEKIMLDRWYGNRILGDKENKPFIDAFLQWIGQDVLQLENDTIKDIMNQSGYNSWREQNDTTHSVGLNLIVYGAPGTGKSYKVNNDKLYGVKIYKDKITRVVFHPEYTYFDFVGSYRPKPIYKKVNGIEWMDIGGNSAKNCPGEPYIDYRFVPGPFTKVLVNALKHPHDMFTLLIEELNRADAAAVFGDVFQLLDRDKDGKSEYPIEPSEEWLRYIQGELKAKKYKELLENIEEKGVYIPSNMNIIATMNSADQGVHLLDTAFKRRWRYKYISVNQAKKDVPSTSKYKTEHIKFKANDDKDQVDSHLWIDFIDAINEKLGNIGIPEDRWIGPYFATEEELKDDGEAAVKKVLFYLWDDVLRNSEYRNEFFGGNIKSLGDMLNDKEKRCNVIKKLLSNEQPSEGDQE